MDKENEAQFQQMRGEYLSLMASLEFNLTLLICDEIGFTDHYEAFNEWFVEAPIPFTSKISLFERMHNGEPILKRFGGMGDQIRELQNFRNTLAHSFIRFDQTYTSKGKEVPFELVSFETLSDKLKTLQRIETYVYTRWFSKVGPMDGGLGPISADDFAGGPR